VTELERLEMQLRVSFEGPAWHGPSVLESLAGLTPEAAFAHPIPGAHSVFELVLHIAAGYRLVLRRLEGGAPRLTPEEDWAPVGTPSPADWDAAVGSLRELNARLCEAVRGFDPARLDQPLVPDPPYTAYTQFIGMTQHDLYHAGQITLLKKALGAGRG
jgi:uncharacterized damage-inducible protein DinB